MESLRKFLTLAVGLPVCPESINPPLHRGYPVEIEYCFWDKCLTLASVDLEERAISITQKYHFSAPVIYAIVLFSIFITTWVTLYAWRAVLAYARAPIHWYKHATSKPLNGPYQSESIVAEGSRWLSSSSSSYISRDKSTSPSTVQGPNSFTQQFPHSNKSNSPSSSIAIPAKNLSTTQNDTVATPMTPDTILTIEELRAKKQAGKILNKSQKQRLQKDDESQYRLTGGSAVSNIGEAAVRSNLPSDIYPEGNGTPRLSRREKKKLRETRRAEGELAGGPPNPATVKEERDAPSDTQPISGNGKGCQIGG